MQGSGFRVYSLGLHIERIKNVRVELLNYTILEQERSPKTSFGNDVGT